MDSNSIFKLLQLAETHFKAYVENVDSKDAIIAQLQKKLEDKDAIINKQVNEQQRVSKELNELTRINTNLKTDLQTYTLALGKTKEKKKELMEKYRFTEILCENYKSQLKNAEDKIDVLEKCVDFQCGRILSLEEQLGCRNASENDDDNSDSHDHSNHDLRSQVIRSMKHFEFSTSYAAILEENESEENDVCYLEDSTNLFEITDDNVGNIICDVECQSSSSSSLIVQSLEHKRQKTVVVIAVPNAASKKKVRRHYSRLFSFAAY